jgi:hypothetical protein
MCNLFTGENIERTDPEYVLRQAFQQDAQRTSAKLPPQIKARMIIKGWNWKRRGMPTCTTRTIAVSATDEQRIVLL